MVCISPAVDKLVAESLSLSCVSKSNTLSFDNGAAEAFSTSDNVGVIILTLLLLSFLGLENPGNSDCCTGCLGSKGKKNLLSVAPIVVEDVFVFD
jgi:hypothetical protein